MSELIRINMRLPSTLLERIDKFKDEKGFSNRTQTVVYLIQRGLGEN